MAVDYAPRYCAVDTETTGLIPRFNDAYEIAIVVLDNHFNVDKQFIPFHTFILPSRPENINIEALKLQNTADPTLDKTLTLKKFKEVMEHGLPSWKVADLIVDWFEKIRLPPKERLVPLGHNFCFDKEFIVDIMGQLSYDYVFHYAHRDSLRLVHAINDTYIFKGEKPPYHPSTRLTDMCLALDFQLINAHTALDDAIAAAEVYKRLMKHIPVL